MVNKQPAKRPRPSPEPGAARTFTPMRTGALAVCALTLVIGAIAYLGSGREETFVAASPSSASPAAPQPAQAPPPEPPPAALLGPHAQKTLPPLPFGSMPPAAPIEVVQSVYRFAAEHPEILSYAPCYCGCERSGHRGNEDCFVTSRAANGDVTGWEPHGMT